MKKYKISILVITLLLFVGIPTNLFAQDETTNKEDQEQVQEQDREHQPEEKPEQEQLREEAQQTSEGEGQPDNRGFVDENGDGFNDNSREDASNQDMMSEEGRKNSREGRENAQKNREEARERQQKRFDNFIDENGDGLNDRRFGPAQGGMPEGIRDKVMDKIGNAREQGKGEKGMPDKAGPENRPGPPDNPGNNNGDSPGDTPDNGGNPNENPGGQSGNENGPPGGGRGN